MKILFISTFYPPNNTGASVVMHNLISALKTKSVYGVVTWANSFFDKDEKMNGIRVHKIFNFQYLFNPRLWFFVRRLTFNYEKRKVIKLIENENITHVIGVYPDLDFLELARSASEKCKIKFYPYLHDTLVEGLSHKRYKHMAKEVQKKIFNSSEKIFVMSEGMKDLYTQKYNIETIPILHSFSENIVKNNYENKLENSIFWGGSIYSINKETVKRIHKACIDFNYKLTLSSANKKEKLVKMGFEYKNIKILPFLSRDEYIKNISNQRALLLSVDWPDESSVHNDELATIFPTKTIEYLISGRPIIVHCPEEYFLSKFFIKYDCGIVINTRDFDKIKILIEKNLNDKIEINRIVENAFIASKQFHISKIKNIFESEL